MMSIFFDGYIGGKSGGKTDANEARVKEMKTQIQKIDKGVAAIFRELRNAARKTNSFASHDTIWQRKDKETKSVMKLPLSEEMESKVCLQNVTVRGHANAVQKEIREVNDKIRTQQTLTEKKKEKLKCCVAEMKDYVEKGGIGF